MGNAVKTFFSSLLLALTVIVTVSPAYADDACKNLFDSVTLLSNGFTETNDGYYMAVPHRPGYILWENTSGYTGRLTLRYKLKYAASGQGFRFRISYTDGTIDNLYTATATDWKTFSHVSAKGKIVASIQGDYGSSIATYVKDIQLEEGTTATSYVPYNPLCATCDGQIENYVSATGTVAQNGTPSPTNPIEPTFYQQGNMVLRKVGDYADSYDAATGKITRRVGVKVLDGTEFFNGSAADDYRWNSSDYISKAPVADVLCSHIPFSSISIEGPFIRGLSSENISFRNIPDAGINVNSVNDFKQYLSQQYSAGTPVTIYYPLAEAVEEAPASTTYCAAAIKIATTAYNSARFNPVKTDLNNAVATIREIVTKTINQTAAIASLQADKQTRPEEACPAGKKCLLVETEENGVIVPHWFPIIESPTD